MPVPECGQEREKRAVMGNAGRLPGWFASSNPSLISRPWRSTGITSCVRLFRVFVVSMRCAGVWASRRR